MKQIYNYLISKYGEETYQPNLYMMIEELQKKVKELEQQYRDALVDIKRLEEENIEASNVLYELQNSIEAVDHRIDILHEENNKPMTYDEAIAAGWVMTDDGFWIRE